MPALSSPTVRRRRLAAELRRLRAVAALSIDQVAKQLEWSTAKISRIENARVRVLPRDVRYLLKVYGVDEHDELWTVLTDLARESHERGWWHQYGDAIPDWFGVYLGLEAEAASVHEYAVELVPGLLQTTEYYRAFMQAAPAVGNSEAIQRKIGVRSGRQERLTADRPPECWAVLNEAVIRRVVGGADVMRAQLVHIAEMADLPHVSIQVLPFRAGAHPAMGGSFVILGFPEAPDPDVVYLESQTGSLYLEKPPEVERYQAMFSHLIAKALDPDESRRIIAEAATGLAEPTR